MTSTRVEPLRNYDQFQKSLRDFHSWLGPVVSGACDIDFCCERNGGFLFIEAKPIETHGITFGYGQHLLLWRLSRQPRTTLWLVGEGKNTLYLADYSTPIPPKFFRRGGKAMVQWEHHALEEITKEDLRRRTEAWWEEQEGQEAAA